MGSDGRMERKHIQRMFEVFTAGLIVAGSLGCVEPGVDGAGGEIGEAGEGGDTETGAADTTGADDESEDETETEDETGEPEEEDPIDYPAPCTVHFDNDNDGLFDLRIDYSYDEGGRLLVERRVRVIDGFELRRDEHDWNEAGLELEHRRYLEGELSSLETWTYDEQGRVLVYESIGSGLQDFVQLTEYLDDTATTRTDFDIDGTIDSLNFRVFDEAGHLIELAQDYDNDGLFESRATRAWVGTSAAEPHQQPLQIG